MQRDISPEERLLALIKGNGKKRADRVLDKSDSNQPKSGTSGLREGHSYIAEIFKLPLFKDKIFDPTILKSLNKYLTAAFLIIMTYFIFELLFIKPHRNIQSLISQKSSDSRPLRHREKGAPPLEAKDYSYYSKEIATKKIFGPPFKEEPSQTTKAPEDITKDLNLVGIIAGEKPQAIIEDKKSQKTYYLTKSGSFNGFTVEEISDGRVVLDYEGKKIALFL